MNHRTRCCGLLACWLLIQAGLAFAGSPGKRWYLAVEAGLGVSTQVAFSDRGAPPEGSRALFGSGYRAQGRWETQPLAGLAVGTRLARHVRLDALFTALPRQRFTGSSNFLTPPAAEPVSGDGQTLAVLARTHLDLAPLLGGRVLGFAPHLGVGGGLAFHHRRALILSYPSLAIPHTLTTPGGNRTQPAWLVEAGLTRPLGGHWIIELNWRYLDGGFTGTAAGDALRVRPTVPSETVIAIGATRAPQRVHLVVAGMRWGWGER